MSRKGSALPRTRSDETSVETPADTWASLFSGPAPRRMDAIVAQAVAWRRQVLEQGDVSPAIARDLAAASADAEAQRTVQANGTVRNGASCTEAGKVGGSPIQASGSSASRAGSSVARSASCNETVCTAAPSRHGARANRKATPAVPLPPASSQLLVGTRLVKTHGGKTHVVEVTADGMLYEGELFASLSAVAKHITGTHWNGLLFFGLRRRKTYPAKGAASA